MEKEYVNVCEHLGWTLYEDEGGWTELSKRSPAGEDFYFSFNTEDFVEEVNKFTAGFDVNEHVEYQILSRRKRGVPSNIRELLKDTEAINKMLRELAVALTDAEGKANNKISVQEPLREWTLGDDLCVSDSLLDGITFDDLITAVQCSCRNITPTGVMRELDEMLDTRKQDMMFLLEKNINIIMDEARKRRGE